MASAAAFCGVMAMVPGAATAVWPVAGAAVGGAVEELSGVLGVCAEAVLTRTAASARVAAAERNFFVVGCSIFLVCVLFKGAARWIGIARLAGSVST